MNSNLIAKTLLISSIYWGLGCLYGCKKENCDEQVFKSYSCYKIALQNLSFTLNEDSLISNEKITDDTVLSAKYGFSIIFEVEKYAHFQPKSSNPFFNTAYAGDCIPYKMEILDKIKKVSIYTVNDFNENYLAGSLISEKFVYLKENAIEKQSLVPIDSIVKRDDYYKIEEYSYGLITPLYLNATASANTKIQFKVVVDFISGKSMTNYTREVYMKN